MDFKSYLFDTLREFSQQEIAIDWQDVMEHEESIETLYDSIETIITSLTFASDIDDQKKSLLIGKLAICRVLLTSAFEEDQEQPFQKAGLMLEAVLRDVLKTGNWLQQAKEQFEGYQELEQAVEGGQEPKAEVISFFRPIFCALGILSVITIDQESEELE